MNNHKSIIFFCSITVFAFFLVLGLGVPAEGVKIEVDIPGQAIAGTEVSGIAEYIKYIYLFVLSSVGVIGLVSLVILGTIWVASGVVDKKAAAIDGIQNTLIGLGLALSASVVLYVINPNLTVINPPKISQVTISPTQEVVGFTDDKRNKYACLKLGPKKIFIDGDYDSSMDYTTPTTPLLDHAPLCKKRERVFGFVWNKEKQCYFSESGYCFAEFISTP